MGTANPLLATFTKLQGLPNGTAFYKADLHFHTPASEDARGDNKYNFNPYQVPYPVKLKNLNYPAELKAVQEGILQKARGVASAMVQRFLAEGLAVVAVTDHNGIGTLWADAESSSGLMDLAAPTWYEIIDDEAQVVNAAMGRTELLVLPGVEISTTGVHILAIFPPQDPRRKVHFLICDLLNEVGFDPDDWGRNPKVGRASVEDALALIQKKGGLAIPAHIDGSDQALLNLYELTGGAMKNVLQSEVLRAVEIVDPARFGREEKNLKKSVKSWMDGLRREAGLPSLAFFQGSDAHDLPSIAKRFTYLKLTKPTFSGLQAAIKMPASRVRIAASYKDFDGWCLHSLAFTHPFLGRQEVHFNRSLNCIAGKKGTGKTSLYKLIQAAVDPASPPPDGETVLFLEQVQAGVSSYYAFSRKAGQKGVDGALLDPNAQTVTALEAARVAEIARQVKFYSPEQVETLIQDKDKLQAYLKENFGAPSAENLKAFNEQFATPRFLDEQADPLLALTLGPDKKSYQLAVNVQWRSGKPELKDFLTLAPGLRRSVLLCLSVLNSNGPVMIDAPEEQFDNDDMMKLLVPIIREHKDCHQILLFTNHPILAVNTDPDNYLLLQAPLAGQPQAIAAGFAVDTDDKPTRALLLNILEGGLEAVKKRASLYNLL